MSLTKSRRQQNNGQQTIFDSSFVTKCNGALRKSDKFPLKRSSTSGIGVFTLDTIYRQDCIEGMRRLPDNTVDLVIADPPYNASKGNSWEWDASVKLPGFGGVWSKVMAEWDDMSLSDYLTFTLSWLSEIKRVLRPTGSLWIHGTYHNIGIINFALQLLKIEIINEIVWYKRNSFPNLSGRRLTASHETILWAHTGKKREYFFNYETTKNLLCPEDHLKEPGKQMRTVWDIPNNKKREEIQFGKHPTQKPVRLLTRMLQISAKEGDVLLVPFAGAGSECIAARNLGIGFLAFEEDPKYVEICEKRLASLDSSDRLLTSNVEKQNKEIAPHREALHRPRFVETIPSLIKWTGSKRSQASAIAKLMPRYRRYLEPFLGGGALLYVAAVPRSIAGDLYEPLIRLWQLVQTDPYRVVEDYEHKWSVLKRELDGVDIGKLKQGNGIPRYYYAVRKRFNQKKDPLDLNFLMRTCVNGIVRFNDEGHFNNSFHLSRRGMEPRQFRSVVEAWHLVIQGVDFLCQDYSKTLEMAGKGDFVYLDPPYAGNRQRYIKDLDLGDFFAALDSLNRRGVKWALSFDGRRGTKDLVHAVPKSLFKRQLLLTSGNSAVNKVLNGPVEQVQESLYLNY